MAEFQKRNKLRYEDWASYGEDLRTLVEIAYPMLQTEAQELLALNRFLSEISDVQLAFGVRQRVPTTLDAAVAATLELETYLHKSSPFVASVNAKSTKDDVVIAASQRSGIEESLQELLKRMDKLEGALGARKDSRQYQGWIWGRRVQQRQEESGLLEVQRGRTLCQKLQKGL